MSCTASPLLENGPALSAMEPVLMRLIEDGFASVKAMEDGIRSEVHTVRMSLERMERNVEQLLVQRGRANTSTGPDETSMTIHEANKQTRKSAHETPRTLGIGKHMAIEIGPEGLDSCQTASPCFAGPRGISFTSVGSPRIASNMGFSASTSVAEEASCTGVAFAPKLSQQIESDYQALTRYPSYYTRSHRRNKDKSRASKPQSRVSGQRASGAGCEPRASSDVKSSISCQHIPSTTTSVSQSATSAGFCGRPSQKTPVQRIVSSFTFDMLSGLLIVCNSLVIGAEIEYKTEVAEPLLIFRMASLAFALLFTVELLLRVSASDVVEHFCGYDYMWNLFDAGMVIISIIEVVDSMASSGAASGSPVLVVRILRLLRIVRVLRFVPQLRLMLACILESLKSLGWLMCILLAFLYVFSIVFTMGATDYLGEPGSANYESRRYSEEVKIFYGSLLRSTYTLFKSITSGQNWGDAMQPLVDVGFVYVSIFAFYIAFSVLALLNVVTGVFVDGALAKSQQDKDLAVERELSIRRACIQNLHELFREGDADESGTISFREFQTHMENPKSAAYLAHLTIDTSNIAELFRLLDQDGSGQISLDEFVDNLMHLIRAQSVEQSVQKVVNECRTVKHYMLKFMDFVEGEFDYIRWRLRNGAMSVNVNPVAKTASVPCSQALTCVSVAEVSREVPRELHHSPNQ